MKKFDDKFLFERISNSIGRQIRNNVLNPGDKLPSIREICRIHAVSMSTAIRAYSELEGKGFIESRPKSGYFVSYTHQKFPSTPKTSNPVSDFGAETTEALIARVYSELGTEDNLLFSLGVPAPELLPISRINKSMVYAMRRMPHSGTSYEKIQGNSELRRQIARGVINWEGELKEEDIVTTAGCMSALTYSISVLAKKGDIIVVESPVYFGILQLARSLGLRVLELATNPVTGMDLDILEKTLKEKTIKLILLVSNFNNPIGSCMPDEHKARAVELAEKYNVPIVEDDLYGDIYFGEYRPRCCKTFDKTGIILWCGSISKTLAPGYRVGWVAPGKFKDQVIRTKLYHSVSSTTPVQGAIAHFLATGRYENHLRKLRNTLHSNSLRYLHAISDSFPEGTRVSRPSGGFLLWVELPKKSNAVKLYETAIKHKISIAPGRMFTLQDQYHNCFRLSYGLVWNETVENSIHLLGKLAKQI
ncbi:PLP-dependent aminotransferase family protein [Membranihabitans maritimus]|uniref:aminotransferase-like domain-containing protein n=1 Tax=Membranihabitans maritimus TaxID=2904244 RepID=UPI001F341930|nr:PLP-dependent aminotransferase family protein [Membranihabitans maritimus]